MAAKKNSSKVFTLTPLGRNPFEIVIAFDLYKVLTYLLDRKYNCEFTVLTHCDRKGNEFYMYDWFIPEQENTGATTDFDADDFIPLLKEGAKIEKMCGHMHSHVNMGVWSSGTDFDDIKEAAEMSGKYACRIVMNKNHNVFGHVYDVENDFYAENVPVKIEVPISGEAFDQHRMNRIKKAKTIEIIKKIVNASLLDYNLHLYPLQKAVKNDVEAKAKSRFKFPKPVHNKKSYNGYPLVDVTKRYGDSKLNQQVVQSGLIGNSSQSTDDEYGDYQILLDQISVTELGITDKNIIDNWSQFSVAEKELAIQGFSYDEIEQAKLAYLDNLENDYLYD